MKLSARLLVWLALGTVIAAAQQQEEGSCSANSQNADGSCAAPSSQPVQIGGNPPSKPVAIGGDPPKVVQTTQTQETASQEIKSNDDCTDHKPDCYAKAKQVGACQNEALRQDCPRSCKVCQRECVDDKPECWGWAQNGECETNPAFMLQHCYKSCLCESGECTDTAVEGTRQCRIWAWHGECEDNPVFMNLNCAKSCGACLDVHEPEPPCEDDAKYKCQQWSETDGLCDGDWRAKHGSQSLHTIDANFVVEFCPVSCGVCDVHLDERDFDLDIGVPQIFPDDEDPKMVRNRVRRKVVTIQQYLQGLKPEVQKYCKLGYDMCARLALSQECDKHKDEDVIKYACAAACEKCEEFEDDEDGQGMILAWYRRARQQYFEKHQLPEPLDD